MSGMIISTDRLISASEARKCFGRLLNDISEGEKNYYVILENGKITALLVHPSWLQEKHGESFPDLEKLRKDWGRFTKDISKALEDLGELSENELPKLLR